MITEQKAQNKADAIAIDALAQNMTIEKNSITIVISGDIIITKHGHAERKQYHSKLAMLSLIHNQIAPKLNAKREALAEIFSGYEDRFIPIQNEDLNKLQHTCQIIPTYLQDEE